VYLVNIYDTNDYNFFSFIYSYHLPCRKINGTHDVYRCVKDTVYRIPPEVIVTYVTDWGRFTLERSKVTRHVYE